MPQTFFKGRDHILKPHKAYFNLILYCSFNLVALKMNNYTLEPFMSLWRLVPARHHNLVSFFPLAFLWKPVKHAVDMIPVKRALKTSSFTEVWFVRIWSFEDFLRLQFSIEWLPGWLWYKYRTCFDLTSKTQGWRAYLLQNNYKYTLRILSHKLLHAAAVVCQKPYPATEHSSAAGSSPWAPGD